jgi:dTDP-4-amino-4,6-dideoxygalactose transaminase
MIPLVDLRSQYLSIKDEIDGAIAEVVESCHFILGEQVEAFEENFAAYCQARFASGVNSGTSALHLALLAAGVGPGDEVITVSYTFVATVAAIRYTGARPIFVDVDPRTCNIDPSQIEAAIASRTKVIMPVHLYGNCADMDPIMEIARRHQLIVIEDAAQAVAAEYRGRRAGSIGHLACFSFYPGKNLGAYGEAGAVVTNDEGYAKLINQLRDHGQSEKYHHERLGYNYRMEAIQGAVLKVKLKYLDQWIKARRSHADSYRRELADADVRLLEETAGSKSVHHIFPVFTPDRDALQRHLQTAGVATGIHYPIPVHLQSGYRDLGYSIGDFPHTERAAAETLSLPMYPELTRENLARVADSVRQFCRKSVAVHS